MKEANKVKFDNLTFPISIHNIYIYIYIYIYNRSKKEANPGISAQEAPKTRGEKMNRDYSWISPMIESNHHAI